MSLEGYNIQKKRSLVVLLSIGVALECAGKVTGTGVWYHRLEVCLSLV